MAAQERTLCQNELGKLGISQGSKVIFPGKSNTTHKGPVFLNANRVFTFTCSSSQGTAKIYHIDRKNVTFEDGSATKEIRSNTLGNTKSGTSFLPFTMGCRDVCQVSVIVIKHRPQAGVCDISRQNRTIRCNIPEFEAGTPGGSSRSTTLIPRTNIHEDFVPTVTYSMFDVFQNEYVKCDEYDDNGKLLAVGNASGEDDTQTLKCPPIDESRDWPDFTVMRREAITRTKVCTALPIFCNHQKCNDGCESVQHGHCACYSFWSVPTSNISAISRPLDEDQEDEYIDKTAFIIVGCCIIAIAVCLGFVCKKYIFNDQQSKQRKNSQFYVENPTTTEKDVEIGMIYQPNLVADEDFEEESCTYSFCLEDNTEEGVKKRKQIISRQLSGDPSQINPALPLNQQAKKLQYNDKYEIDRTNFQMGQLIGCGNFGSVYEGTASGLFHPGSQTKVAIKTVNDALDKSQWSALMMELKILSNLELHLSLVNTLGIPSASELCNGDIWILLEFCPHGDLKTFLIKHREEFKNSNKDGLNERLFLKWSHSIAKGMEYLSSKRIMHGDLAARNILIGDNYVAKVADFGLSKTFYDNIRYRKQERPFVPWKWMSSEYLQDGCFTMKSDVWSYGVIIWEILSLGQEPYMGKDIENTIKEIRNGYRLPCPDVLTDRVEWLHEFYQQITSGCWKADPVERVGFAELVKLLEHRLSQEEINDHEALNAEYIKMRMLLDDETTRSKRTSSQIQPSRSYHKMLNVIGDQDHDNVPPKEVLNLTPINNDTSHATPTVSVIDVPKPFYHKVHHVTPLDDQGAPTNNTEAFQSNQQYLSVQALTRRQDNTPSAPTVVNSYITMSQALKA